LAPFSLVNSAPTRPRQPSSSTLAARQVFPGRGRDMYSTPDLIASAEELAAISPFFHGDQALSMSLCKFLSVPRMANLLMRNKKLLFPFLSSPLFIPRDRLKKPLGPFLRGCISKLERVPAITAPHLWSLSTTANGKGNGNHYHHHHHEAVTNRDAAPRGPMLAGGILIKSSRRQRWKVPLSSPGTCHFPERLSRPPSPSTRPSRLTSSPSARNGHRV